MSRLAAWHRKLSGPGPHSLPTRLLILLLTPIGWLYGAVGAARAALYRRGIFSVYRAPVPVISIGNLAVGGTGKTPMADYVIKYLLSLGRKVAVVSRGYGGRGVAGEVGIVSVGGGPLLDPGICGDEPYLLAWRNPEAIVLVAPRRSAGVRLALERFGAEVIVLDDAFQHLAVARDLNIVLLDGRAPLGNGHLLPTGVLREFPAALQRGNLFVLTRCNGDSPALPPLSGPVLHSRHLLADTALSLEGETIPLGSLAGRRGAAFAGIADPAAFFAALNASGLTLAETVALPDHARFGREEMRRIEAATQRVDYLITTEKDAVKLLNQSFPVPCYRVALRMAFQENGELEKMVQKTVEGGEHGHFPRAS